MSSLDKASFWNGKHELSSEQERVFEKFVPPMGRTEYLQAECLRALARVYYDFYNNGWGNIPLQQVKFLEMYYLPLVTNPEVYAAIKKALVTCASLLYRLEQVEELPYDEYEAQDFIDVFDHEGVIIALELLAENVLRTLLDAERDETLVRTNLDNLNT